MIDTLYDFLLGLIPLKANAVLIIDEAQSLPLGILEQNLPPEHFGTASILNNLARLYYRRARYTEAEPLYLRSLAILEKTLGSDHPAVAESLRNLADLYRAEGRAGEAEALDQRSVVIRRAAHGSSKTCNDCP